MKQFSYGISVMFHPLFMSLYFLIFIYLINPSFIDFSSKNSGLVVIQMIASTVIFPMVGVFLMKNLGFINSLDMKENKERVGPLLLTSIFYIWMFLSFKRGSFVPDYISFFLLGGTIALFISFFITLFYKVSIHAISMAGLITSLFIIKTKYFFYEFGFSLFGNSFVVSSDLLLMILIVLGGLVGTSRIYLKDHTLPQVYVGYVVGFLSMLLANIIFFKI